MVGEKESTIVLVILVITLQNMSVLYINYEIIAWGGG